MLALPGCSHSLEDDREAVSRVFLHTAPKARTNNNPERAAAARVVGSWVIILMLTPMLNKLNFQILVRNQFLRGLTVHCCLSGIRPSHSPQATALGLSISCQPLPSETHAFEPLTFGNRLVQILRSLEFTLPVEGTHTVEENATLVRWHVKKNFNVCTCFSHRLREDRSAMIKPCLYESVIRGSTVHPVRVRTKFMYCSVFSNSRIGNSLKTLLEASSLFIASLSSSSSIGSRPWCDVRLVPVKNIAHAASKMEK